MASSQLKTQLRNSRASLDDITNEYVDWVTEDAYMILNRFNSRTMQHDTFAVLLSKRP